MKAFNLLTVAAKYVVRNRTRSLLTIVGVATGMFLFATIETMQESVRVATETTANDTTQLNTPFQSRIASRQLTLRRQQSL